MSDRDAAEVPRHRAVVLLGKPGSGKSTQGHMLAEAPGLVHVVMGDVLRAARHRPGIGARLDRGELIPDAQVMGMLLDHLDGLAAADEYIPGENLLILDGVPRTVDQARALAESVDVRRVISIRCDDEGQLLRRLERRAEEGERSDDADPEVVRARLERHDRRLQPVIAWYARREGVLAEVDGLRPPLEVRDEIVRELLPVMRDAATGP